MKFKKEDLTAKNVVQEVMSNSLGRPCFQRELVWKRAMASYLIDSIMKGYPIPSSLIDWKMSKRDINFPVYKLAYNLYDKMTLDDVIELNGASEEELLKDLFLRCDGQQKTMALASMFLSSGTWNKKKAYINLLSDIKNNSDIWETEWFSDKDIKKSKSDKNKYWFRLSDTMSLTTDKIKQFEFREGYTSTQKDKIKKSLITLLENFENKLLFNRTICSNSSLAEMFDYFTRVNNSSVKLDEEDYIIGYITVYHNDFGEKLSSLVKELKDKTSKTCGYSFDKHNIMRFIICMVGMNFDTRVSDMSEDLANKIYDDWDSLDTSIIETLEYLDGMNITKELCPEINSLILPLIYRYQKGKFVSKDKTNIYEYELNSSWTRIFKGHTTNIVNETLRFIRKPENEMVFKEGFNFKYLKTNFITNDKALGKVGFTLSESEIEEKLNVDYSNVVEVKRVLSLAYLSKGIITDWKNMDIDHIEAVSKNTVEELMKLGFDEIKATKLVNSNLFNKIGNLQPLNRHINRDIKKDKFFSDYLMSMDDVDRNHYIKHNFTPIMSDYDIKYMEERCNLRFNLLKDSIRKIIGK